MKLIDRKTNELVEVPDADVPKLAATGMFAIPHGARMPVALESGEIGSVDASEAMQAFADNATVPTEQAYRAAQSEARYGGPGGTAAAAGVGALRGGAMAFWMPFDEAAIDTANLLGAPDDVDDPYRGRMHRTAGQRLREDLAGLEQAHPYASQAGELAGLVGAGVATGGESFLGELGKGAESLAPKAAGRIARGAFRGAGEGAGMGAVSAINESALGDTDVTAEKVVAGMGHGAFMGAGLGAAFSGLGVAKDAARDQIGRFASRLAPRDIEALATKAYGYAPEGLGERVQKHYARASAAASGKDAATIDRFTALTPEGAEARRVAVFDAPKIQADAEREIRRHVDEIASANGPVTDEARGELKADYVKRAVKNGNESEARAYALSELDRIINGATAQLEHEGGVAPSMRKSLESVRELAYRARAAANGVELVGYDVPYIDADAGLEGAIGTKKAFTIGREMGLDPDAGLFAPDGGVQEPIFPSGRSTKTTELKRVPLDSFEHQAVWEPKKLEALRRQLADGGELAPIKLVRGADGEWQIADGIHRTALAKELGMPDILAELTEYQEPMRLAGDAFRVGKDRVKATGRPIREGTRIDLAPDAESVVTAKKKPIAIDPVKAPVKDNARLFMELDSMKRALQRVSKKGTLGARNISDPLDMLNAERALEWMKGAASDVRAGLEDEALWGKSALDQRTINAKWTKQLDASERFHRALTTETIRDPNDPYRRLRGADPSKVASYVKNLTNPNNDLTHTAVRDYVTSTRELADAIASSYDLPPEKLAEVARLRAAAEGFGATLSKAEKALVTANQYRALTEGTTDSLSALLGTVGGVFGGLPGGILGAAAGAVANPGRVVAQLAAVERLSMQVDTRIGSSIRDFFRGASRRPAPLLEAEAATPKGFDIQVRQLTESVDADGNITPVGRERIATAIGDLGDGAPKLATAVGIKAMQVATFLAGKVPPAMRSPYEMFPGEEPPLVSDSERATFARYVAAANDPMSVVDHLARGDVTPEEAEVLKTCYPRLYESAQAQIDAANRAAQAKGKPIDYGKRVTYGILFEVRTDATMDPEVLMAVSSARAKRSGKGGMGGMGGGMPAPSRLRGAPSLAGRFATNSEAAASRRRGGGF